MRPTGYEPAALPLSYGPMLNPKNLAPRAGFEPATLRLTAGCSTVELSRNVSTNAIVPGMGSTVKRTLQAVQAAVSRTSASTPDRPDASTPGSGEHATASGNFLPACAANPHLWPRIVHGSRRYTGTVAHRSGTTRERQVPPTARRTPMHHRRSRATRREPLMYAAEPCPAWPLEDARTLDNPAERFGGAWRGRTLRPGNAR